MLLVWLIDIVWLLQFTTIVCYALEKSDKEFSDLSVETHPFELRNIKYEMLHYTYLTY
jgi:hypothetical protein